MAIFHSYVSHYRRVVRIQSSNVTRAGGNRPNWNPSNLMESCQQNDKATQLFVVGPRLFNFHSSNFLTGSRPHHTRPNPSNNAEFFGSWVLALGVLLGRRGCGWITRPTVQSVQIDEASYMFDMFGWAAIWCSEPLHRGVQSQSGHKVVLYRFWCFQAISWGGASQGGRINVRLWNKTRIPIWPFLSYPIHPNPI